MAATKNIISELNKGIKLSGENFRIWRMRVSMVLNEMNAQEHTTKSLVRPSGELTNEQRTTHEQWEAKDAEVRAALLSMMDDDILFEFEQYQTCKELWDALRQRFGVYTTAQLRSLNIAFDSYRLKPEHNMRQHLRKMINMIAELREAGQVLTEEQKIQSVIRSLPDSWEHMKMQLAHSDHLKTLEDVRRHIELEEDRLNSKAKVKTEAHVASSRASGRKNKRARNAGKGGAGPSQAAPPKGEQNPQSKKGEPSNPQVPQKEKRRCYNCNTPGHLIAECRQPLKVSP